MVTYKIVRVMEHWHAYVEGKFICSGDTQKEVIEEVEKYLMERR